MKHRKAAGSAVVVAVGAVSAALVLALAGPQGRSAAVVPPLAPTTGAPANSIAATQAQLRDEPRNWLAWANLGVAYVQQARTTADPTYYPKAQQALDRSLRLQRRGNYVALVGLGTLAAARHDFSGALRRAQQALVIDPQSAAAYDVMTDALNELGRYDDAVRAVQHAVDLSPGVSTFTRVSYVRELRGDVAGAVAAMRQARDAATNVQDIAFCDYYLGELAFGGGDLTLALHWYADGLRGLPSSPMLLEGRAKVEAARHDDAAAIRDYTSVVNMLPLPQYAIEFGDYLSSVRRTGDAAQEYALVRVEQRLFRANGVNTDLDIALFDAEHGDAKAAVAAARAEWSRRHSIIVADAYAWALHAAGDDRSAIRYARVATGRGYRNATFYFHQGVIESALGEKAAGQADLRRALDINPNFSPLHAPVARALLAAGG